MRLLPLLLISTLGCRTTESAQPATFLGNPACPMSGNPVDPESFFEHEGQRVYFCNPHCARDGSLEPERFIAAAYPAVRPLGNSSCPACGESVGETSVNWQGRRVGLCGPACEEAFLRNPAAGVRRVMIER